MRHSLVTAFAFTAALAVPAWAGPFADATGRTVEIPDNPTRVFAAGPPSAVLLYTLKPEAMVGWARGPVAADLPYLRPETRDLPELGRLTGKGDTVNLEVLLSAKPDLIVDYGTVNPTYLDLAARVQDQAGVPYILIDGSFAKLPASIRQMSAALNVAERGEALAAYAEATFAEVDALLAEIPPEQRPTVYLARGPEGLEAPAKGSINAEIIERVGGRNVVEVDTKGLANVSPEQVQAWAPEVIVTIDAKFAAEVKTKPEWQTIPAVANGRVYLAPASPFGFIDTPPSVNRLIGLKWLMHSLYPKQAKGDLVQEVKDFYELFYGAALSDAEVTALLGE